MTTRRKFLALFGLGVAAATTGRVGDKLLAQETDRLNEEREQEKKDEYSRLRDRRIEELPRGENPCIEIYRDPIPIPAEFRATAPSGVIGCSGVIPVLKCCGSGALPEWRATNYVPTPRRS